MKLTVLFCVTLCVGVISAFRSQHYNKYSYGNSGALRNFNKGVAGMSGDRFRGWSNKLGIGKKKEEDATDNRGEKDETSAGKGKMSYYTRDKYYGNNRGTADSNDVGDADVDYDYYDAGVSVGLKKDGHDENDINIDDDYDNDDYDDNYDDDYDSDEDTDEEDDDNYYDDDDYSDESEEEEDSHEERYRKRGFLSEVISGMRKTLQLLGISGNNKRSLKRFMEYRMKNRGGSEYRHHRRPHHHHHHHMQGRSGDWKQHIFEKFSEYMSKHINDFDTWAETEKWYLMGLKMFLKHHVKDTDNKKNITDLSEYKSEFLKSAKLYHQTTNITHLGQWFDKIHDAEWVPQLFKECREWKNKHMAWTREVRITPRRSLGAKIQALKKIMEIATKAGISKADLYGGAMNICMCL